LLFKLEKKNLNITNNILQIGITMSGGLQIVKTDGMAVYPMKNFNAHVVSY